MSHPPNRSSADPGRGAEPGDLLGALESSLSGFGDGEPSDDVAALALAPVPPH